MYLYKDAPSGYWLGDSRVLGCFASGNGNRNDFVGNPNTGTGTYLNINEIGPDTSNYNQSATNGAIDLFKFNIPTGTSGIYGVKTSIYAQRDNTEDAWISPIASGLDQFDAPSGLLLLNNQFYHGIWENNPDTSGFWSNPDLENFQFGYQATK